MPEIEYRPDHGNDDSLRDRLVDELVRYNDARAEHEQWSSLSVSAWDHGSTLVGGAYGYTHWGWLVIQYLWVHEAFRGLGIGQNLLERIEAEGRIRACHSVHLDTHSFQAPDFYLSMGYEVFGQLEDYPRGHTRYFLMKRLSDEAVELSTAGSPLIKESRLEFGEERSEGT